MKNRFHMLSIAGVLMIYPARGFLREGMQRSSEDAREKLLNRLP